jgi:hypothetical protein
MSHQPACTSACIANRSVGCTLSHHDHYFVVGRDTETLIPERSPIRLPVPASSLQPPRKRTVFLVSIPGEIGVVSLRHLRLGLIH